jgi:hypothetical protein
MDLNVVVVYQSAQAKHHQGTPYHKKEKPPVVTIAFWCSCRHEQSLSTLLLRF